MCINDFFTIIRCNHCIKCIFWPYYYYWTFGTKTKTAVEAFQNDNDLTKDGVCGPKTWAALDSTAYYTAEVTASALNVRSGAGTKYNIKSVVKKGDKVIVVSTSGNWARLINDAGWVSLSYIKRV